MRKGKCIWKKLFDGKEELLKELAGQWWNYHKGSGEANRRIWGKQTVRGGEEKCTSCIFGTVL